MSFGYHAHDFLFTRAELHARAIYVWYPNENIAGAIQVRFEDDFFGRVPVALLLRAIILRTSQPD